MAQETRQKAARKATQINMQWLMSRGWIQDQHGAWPMVLVPIVLGASLAGWLPVHGLLLLAWLSGFHLFNVCSLWAKVRSSSRRRGRYLPAMGVWAGVTALFGVVLVVVVPTILWWGVAFAPLIAVSVWEAWRKNERALLARGSSILASSLMLPVAVWMSEAALASSSVQATSPGGTTLDAAGFSLHGAIGQSWADFVTWLRFEHVPISEVDVWGVSAVLAVYFLATVPYVRSLIRGRNDQRWLIGSVAFHIAAALVVTALWVWGVSFATLALSVLWWLVALRAGAVPWAQRRGVRIRPAHIGAGEFVVTTLLVCALWSAVWG